MNDAFVAELILFLLFIKIDKPKQAPDAITVEELE